jgi:ribosome-binding factor A
MSIRTERLSNVIRNDLGDILRDYQQGAMVSVTQVRMTPDLGQAKVYLSVFVNGRSQEEVYRHIQASTPTIRGELAKKIRHQVRRIPELVFYMDDTVEYVNRIEQVFTKIREQRGETGSTENDTDE